AADRPAGDAALIPPPRAADLVAQQRRVSLQRLIHFLERLARRLRKRGIGAAAVSEPLLERAPQTTDCLRGAAGASRARPDCLGPVVSPRSCLDRPAGLLDLLLQLGQEVGRLRGLRLLLGAPRLVEFKDRRFKGEQPGYFLPGPGLQFEAPQFVVDVV